MYQLDIFYTSKLYPNQNYYKKTLNMKTKKTFTMKSEEGIIRFDSNQLEYITINGYLATFHLENNQSFNQTISLKQLEAILSPLFFRINRDSMVNLTKVQRYSKRKRKAILRNGNTLTVSTRRLKQFEKALTDLDGTLIG